MKIFWRIIGSDTKFSVLFQSVLLQANWAFPLQKLEKVWFKISPSGLLSVGLNKRRS